MAVIFIMAAMPAFAADAVYSTAGATWAQTDDVTWKTTIDVDGTPHAITLKKEGNEWKYYFEVADTKANYYVYEDPVPNGYTVKDGKGGRTDPLIVGAAGKVSHTPNIDVTGAQKGNYANSLNTNEVITIPGASKLHVKITYGGESASYDWACAWAGNHPSYMASNNSGTSFTGKLGGGSHTAASNTKEYDIDGDTVTFAFWSDGSGYGDGYGYYAVVTDPNAALEGTITNTTNNPMTYGSLSLTKNVTGSAGDTDKNFGFDIELKTDPDAAEQEKVQKLIEGEKSFGSVPFKDGKATVYLKSGETVSMKDIPRGVKWTIKETTDDGYTTTNTVNGTAGTGKDTSGTISENVETAVIYTNHKDSSGGGGGGDKPSETLGSVKIKKTVVNGNDTDDFTFTASLSGLHANSSYTVTTARKNGSTSDKTFNTGASGSGSVQFDLKNGDMAEIKDMPAGSQYIIKEDAAKGYTAKFSITGDGVISGTPAKENPSEDLELSTAKEALDKKSDGTAEAATVEFTNTAPEPEPEDQTIDIPVTKVWSDNNNAGKTRPESITVYLDQGTANKDGSVTDYDTIATATLDETNSWTYTFEDLEKFHGDGVTEYSYAVRESDVEGYTGEIKKDDDGSFTITNTLVNTGDLKISKTVTGKDADKTKEFAFTVALTKDGKPVSGTFSLDKDKGTKTGSVYFDENGKAGISLKDGESAYITMIPDGTAYTVTEKTVKRWKSSLPEEGASGTISRTLSDVSVTNTYNETAEITVSKKVAGNMSDKSKQFRFELTLKGDDVPESLTVTKDGTDTVATGKNGVFAFTLSHGGTAVIKEVPIGLTYTVSEPDAEKDGYKVTTEGTASGTLTDAVSMTFTNTRNVGVPTGAFEDGKLNVIILFVLIMASVGVAAWISAERKHE